MISIGDVNVSQTGSEIRSCLYNSDAGAMHVLQVAKGLVGCEGKLLQVAKGLVGCEGKLLQCTRSVFCIIFKQTGIK